MCTCVCDHGMIFLLFNFPLRQGLHALVCFAVSVIKHQAIWFTAYSSSRRGVTAGAQGNNLKAGTNAEAMDEHGLLTYSLLFTQPVFLYNPVSPVQVWHHPQWASPLKSIINEWNVSVTCTGQSDGDNASTEVPSSKVTLVCVRLTKIYQHTQVA